MLDHNRVSNAHKIMWKIDEQSIQYAIPCTWSKLKLQAFINIERDTHKYATHEVDPI